jgi:hypothetical protein
MAIPAETKYDRLNIIYYIIIERNPYMINPNNVNRGYYFFTPVNIINTFRKLWEQHGLWTRSFIISTAAGLPDLQPVTDRLLRNPTDFARTLEPFYGERAKEFEKLLRGHLLIAAKLVNDAKKGDTKSAAADRKDWYQNADDIAYYLSKLNPFWSYPEWQDMLHMHLKLVEDEAVKRLGGKYSEDVALYDTLEEQALEMADEMSRGIISQFHLDKNRMTF